MANGGHNLLIMLINIYYMRLEIDGERLIEDVQKDFTRAFPFLKIEFFKNGPTRQDRYPANKKIDHQQKLKYSWFWKKDRGYLDIEDSDSVLKLENAFIDQFGLSAQVYRKSGNVWLETTMTDNWTLKQQNDHGREISMGIKPINDEDNNDYELNRDSDH
jgi:hypothetical protein